MKHSGKKIIIISMIQDLTEIIGNPPIYFIRLNRSIGAIRETSNLKIERTIDNLSLYSAGKGEGS